MKTRPNMPASTSSVKFAVLLALACLAAYANTLRARDFIFDDDAVIAGNTYLHQGWKAAGALASTGYWEMVRGGRRPPQVYRPVLMLSILAQTATTGFRQAPLRAANLLLHFAVCLLLWRLLARRLEPAAAAAGTLVFAVMPAHTETVAMVTGRSELISAALLMGAWLFLDIDSPRPRAAVGAAPRNEEDVSAAPRPLPYGAALFTAAMLTKESSVAFPLLLAADDWIQKGRTAFSRTRLMAHGALWACAAAALALRAAVLTRFFNGGWPYFPSRLAALLTMPRFYFLHYFWPAVSGAGLCTDFSRPAIADGSPAALGPWLWLAAAAALAAVSLYCLVVRRAPWAFWLIGPALFLLPTSNLVFPIDTIGAQRYLYIPTWGAAAGAGWLYARARRAAPTAALAVFAGLLVWYAYAARARNETYLSAADYYEAASSCNPFSSKARTGLGGALAAAGRRDEAAASLREAVRLDPAQTEALYDLGRLAQEGGRSAEAEALARRALTIHPDEPDYWLLLAAALDAQGQGRSAQECLEKALAIDERSAVAHYNLGMRELRAGRAAEGLAHLARFVDLAPDDPDAPKVAALLKEARHVPAR